MIVMDITFDTDAHWILTNVIKTHYRKAVKLMTDRAYIIIRTFEDKIAIAENNDQNTMLVTLDVLKEILALLKEQEDKIRQLRLALQIMNGNGIKVDTEGE